MDTLAVAIATTGRPSVLTETLREVGRQTLLPDRVLVCPAKESDIDRADLSTLPFPVEIFVAETAGSACQRNVLLAAAGNTGRPWRAHQLLNAAQSLR